MMFLLPTELKSVWDRSQKQDFYSIGNDMPIDIPRMTV